MKERPILFSTPMVQAILAGQKTQTRRIVKGDIPHDAHDFNFLGDRPEWTKRKIQNSWMYFVEPEYGSYPCDDDQKLKCPYGQPGDLLWVRETFVKLVPDHIKIGRQFAYKAGYGKEHFPMKWKPSIHMPKEAARIWLKVKDVRVERLLDISGEDAENEGVEKAESGQWKCYDPSINDGKAECAFASISFMTLWASIHGPESYNENPWVWVVEFERVDHCR